ncbi:MAG: hypothetical protein Q9188_001952 [Gyalolechia gomerana]
MSEKKSDDSENSENSSSTSAEIEYSLQRQYTNIKLDELICEGIQTLESLKRLYETEMPLLHYYTCFSDIKSLQAFLKTAPDLNEKWRGLNAFRIALAHSDMKKLRALLEAGVQFEDTDQEGIINFAYVIHSRKQEQVLLDEQLKRFINYRKIRELPTLYSLVRLNCPQGLRWASEEGFSMDLQEENKTALMLAAYLGHGDSVEALLDLRPSTDSREVKNAYGLSEKHWCSNNVQAKKAWDILCEFRFFTYPFKEVALAISRSLILTLNQIIEGSKGSKHPTMLLWLAAREGKKEAVEHLIKRGVDPTITVVGKTIFMQPWLSSTMAKIIIPRAKQLDQLDYNGRSLLHHASIAFRDKPGIEQMRIRDTYRDKLREKKDAKTLNLKDSDGMEADDYLFENPLSKRKRGF